MITFCVRSTSNNFGELILEGGVSISIPTGLFQTLVLGVESGPERYDALNGSGPTPEKSCFV